MKARLIYRNKVVSAECITEFVIWELPNKAPDRPHGLKYRLYHGKKSGQCIVRYDNESGKGDHKHIKGKEVLYTFVTVEQLISDFLSDITSLTHEEKHDE